MPLIPRVKTFFENLTNTSKSDNFIKKTEVNVAMCRWYMTDFLMSRSLWCQV